MKSPICDMLGIEFPLLAFSHCRDVVAAVSRAGGFGVLGATAHSPEIAGAGVEMDRRACAMASLTGIDVLIPENISTAGEKDVTWKIARAAASRRSIAILPEKPAEETWRRSQDRPNVSADQPQPFDGETCAANCWTFRFGIRSSLIANALGVPPKAMIEMGRRRIMCRWRHWWAPRNMRSARSRRVSIFSSCTRHRGWWPLRRGLDHGAGARGDQGHQADPQCAGAGGPAAS